jgi:copper chaperone CopZ
MKHRLNKIATISILVFFLCFLFSSPVTAQTNTVQEKVYIKIEIKGMACPYCAFGMEKKLKEVSGVDNVEIELKEGLAYISTPIDQKPLETLLKHIITDAGFTVGVIEYSNKPFIVKKGKDN